MPKPKAKLIYTLQPQRRASGWQPCPEHQAQRFALLEVRTRAHMRHERVIFASPSKSEALAVQESYIAQQLRRERKAKLRQPAIASSLTQAQYLKLKEQNNV